jgi:hypothetical protein
MQIGQRSDGMRIYCQLIDISYEGGARKDRALQKAN